MTTWLALESPIALAQQMWNHASTMLTVMKTKEIKWPSLTSQQLTDLMVYLRNLDTTSGKPVNFGLSSPEAGQKLLETKGCLNCHTGENMDLTRRLSNGTLTDFAVDMWNHAPKMWELARL